MSQLNLIKRDNILQGLKQQIRQRGNNKNQVKKVNISSDKRIVKDLDQFVAISQKKLQSSSNQFNTISVRRKSQTIRLQRQRGNSVKINIAKESSRNEQQNWQTKNLIDQIISLVKYTVTSANKALALSNVQSQFEAKVAYKLYCSDRDILTNYIQKVTNKKFVCSFTLKDQKIDQYMKIKQNQLFIRPQKDNTQLEFHHSRARDSTKYKSNTIQRDDCQKQESVGVINLRLVNLFRSFYYPQEVEQYINQISYQSKLKEALRNYSLLDAKQESSFEQKQQIFELRAKAQSNLSKVQKKIQSIQRDITYKVRTALQSNQNYDETSIEMQKLRIFINQKIVPELRSCGFGQKLNELQNFNVFQIIKLYLQCMADIKVQLAKQLQKTKEINQEKLEPAQKKHYYSNDSNQMALLRQISQLKKQIQLYRNSQRKSQQFTSIPQLQIKNSSTNRVSESRQMSGNKHNTLNLKKNFQESFNFSAIQEIIEKDNRDLRTRLCKSQRDYKNLHKKIQNLQQQIDKVKLENKENQGRYNEEIGKLQQQNYSLFQTIKKLKSQQKKKSTIIKGKQNYDQQLSECSEIPQYIRNSQHKRLSQVINSKNSRITQLSKRLQSKQNQLESLIIKNAGKIAQMEKKHRDHDFQVSSNLKEKDNIIIELRRQLLSKQFMFSQNKQKQTKLKNQFNTKLQQQKEFYLQQKNSIIYLKQEQFKRNRKSLQQKIDQLSKQVNNQKNEQQKKLQDNQLQYIRKLQQKQKELKQYERKIESQKWQMKRSFIEQLNQSIEIQKQRFQQQRARIFQELSNAKTSLLQIQQKLTHAKWQQDTLSKNHEYSVKQYSQKLEQKQQEIASNNANYLQRIKLIETKLDEQSIQLEAYKRNIKEIVSINKNLSDQKKMLYQKVCQLQNKINEICQSQVKNNEQRERTQESYKVRIGALQQGLKIQESKSKALQNQLKLKQEEQLKTKLCISQLNSMIQSEQAKNSQLKKQKFTIQQRLENVEAMKDKFEIKCNQLEQYNQELIEKVAQSEQYKTQKDMEISQLNKANRIQMDQKIQQIKQQFLQTQIQQLKREMEKQFEIWKCQLLLTKNNLLEDNQNLRAIIQNREIEIKKLEEKIFQLNNKITNDQERILKTLLEKEYNIKMLNEQKSKAQQKLMQEITSLKSRIEELDQISTTLSIQKNDIENTILKHKQKAAKTQQLLKYIQNLQQEKFKLVQQLRQTKFSSEKITKELQNQLAVRVRRQESQQKIQKIDVQLDKVDQPCNNYSGYMCKVHKKRIQQLQLCLKQCQQFFMEFNTERLSVTQELKKYAYILKSKIQQLFQYEQMHQKCMLRNSDNSRPVSEDEKNQKIKQLETTINNMKRQKEQLKKAHQSDVEHWEQKYSEERHSSILKDYVIKQYQKEIDQGPQSENRNKILESLREKKQKISDLQLKIKEKKQSEKIKTERIFQLSEQLCMTQKKVQQLTKRIINLTNSFSQQKITLEKALKQKQGVISSLQQDLSVAKGTLEIKMRSEQNLKASIVQIPFSQSGYSDGDQNEQHHQREKIIKSEHFQTDPHFQQFRMKAQLAQKNKIITLMGKQQLLEFLAKSIKNGNIWLSSIKPQMLQPLIDQANQNQNLRRDIYNKAKQIQNLKKLLFNDESVNNPNQFIHSLIPSTQNIDDFLSTDKKSKIFSMRSRLPSMQEQRGTQQLIAELKDQMQSNQQLYQSVLQQKSDQIEKLKQDIRKKDQLIENLQGQVADFDRSQTQGETGIQVNTLQEIKKFKQILVQIMAETQKKLTLIQNQKNQLSDAISAACKKTSGIFLLLGCQGRIQNSTHGLLKMLQAIHEKSKSENSLANCSKIRQISNNSGSNKKIEEKPKQKLKQSFKQVVNQKLNQQSQNRKSVHERMKASNMAVTLLEIPNKKRIPNDLKQDISIKQPQQQMDIRKTSQGRTVAKSDRKHQQLHNDEASRMIRSERNFDWCTNSLNKNKKRQADSDFLKKMQKFLVTNKETLENETRRVKEKYQTKKRIQTLSKKARTGEINMMESLELGQILQSVVDEQQNYNQTQIFSPLKRKKSMQSAKLISVEPKSPGFVYTPNRLGENEQLGSPSYRSPVSSSSRSLDRTHSSQSSKQRIINSHRDMQQVSEIISEEMSGLQDSDERMKQDFSPQNLKELSCKESFRDRNDKNIEINDLSDKLDFDGQIEQFKIAVNAPNSSQLHQNPIRTESFFLSVKPIRATENNQLKAQQPGEQLRLTFNKQL